MVVFGWLVVFGLLVVFVGLLYLVVFGWLVVSDCMVVFGWLVLFELSAFVLPLQQNKQRIAQLQPKIAELKEKNKEMAEAEGVDPQEYKELQSELEDFDSRWLTATEDVKEEEKRYVNSC